MSEPVDELIGTVWVDSGCVMIVDPCYMCDMDSTRDDEWYKGVCESLFSDVESPPGAAEIGGLVAGGSKGAVASFTAYGDGIYPVYAEKDADGVTTALRISFA